MSKDMSETKQMAEESRQHMERYTTDYLIKEWIISLKSGLSH